jgi:hypothetical protein
MRVSNLETPPLVSVRGKGVVGEVKSHEIYDPSWLIRFLTFLCCIFFAAIFLLVQTLIVYRNKLTVELQRERSMHDLWKRLMEAGSPLGARSDDGSRGFLP